MNDSDSELSHHEGCYHAEEAPGQHPDITGSLTFHSRGLVLATLHQDSNPSLFEIRIAMSSTTSSGKEASPVILTSLQPALQEAHSVMVGHRLDLFFS